MAPSTVLLVLPILSCLLLHWAHADCEPATCGDITVRYPFWLGAANQPAPEPSCGPPAFELWCAGNGTNTTSASMRGSSIHVLSIDYAAGTFVASHTRVATGEDGVCRTDLNVSSSIALSPFRISATNRALCFLYRCNGTEPRGNEFVNATGGCDRAIYAYLGGSYHRDTPPVIDSGNCTYAYLPVLGSEAEAATETAADYGRMLKAGFLLEWSGVGIGDCGACVASGGECRYSNVSAAFACLCPGGAGGRKLLHGSTCAGVCVERESGDCGRRVSAEDLLRRRSRFEGNMGGNKLKKALSRKVGSVKALIVGSSSAPPPPPSPPRARGGRCGSTRTRQRPTRTPSPPPAEQPDEDDPSGDPEYDPEQVDEDHPEVQSDSGSESLQGSDELLAEASEEDEEDGSEEEDEGRQEEEGPGEDGFELDQTLQWHPPAEWVETEEDIPEPRTRPVYQRGAAGLPDHRYYAYKNCLLVPVGKRTFEYQPPKVKEQRTYASILGCCLRKFFPGIVTEPDGRRSVAWTFKHYCFAEDPDGEYPNMGLKTLGYFWNFFTCRAEDKARCEAILLTMASKMVTDMHYEARVHSVRTWYAEKNIALDKKRARDILMQPWQYLQVPPPYVGNNKACHVAMVAWWTSPEYLKLHAEGKAKRAENKGGTHRQGNLSLSQCIQNEKLKTGVDPSPFAVWEKMRTRDTPDPETGSMWISQTAELRSTGYREKFKERNGEEADPLTSPLDVEAVVLAGQGAANGRLWIGDGSIDPRTVPSLRQVRRGRASGAPAVETRPRVSSLAVDELRQKQVLYEQQLERQQEQIRQQEELMRQQQEHQRQVMEWMYGTMQRLSPADGAVAMGMFPPPPPPMFPWMNPGSAGGSHSTAPPLGGQDNPEGQPQFSNPSVVRRLPWDDPTPPPEGQ